MKFSIVLAALTIVAQSSYVPSYRRYYYPSYAPTPAPAPAPAPTPAPTPVQPAKCTLLNEEVGPSGVCKCKEGFVRRQNICVSPATITCGQFEVAKDGVCICQSGFSRDARGFCVTQLKCGPYEHIDPANRSVCKCDLGYEKVGTSCVQICYDNQVRNATGFCDCKAPLKRDQYGNCVTNPVPPTVCEDNAHFDAHKGCVCDDGFVASGKACVKPCDVAGGFTLFPDGTCKKCRANEEPGKSDCICIKGFYYGSDGVCTNDIICGDFEFKDYYGRCVCQPDTFRNSLGFCRPLKEHKL